MRLPKSVDAPSTGKGELVVADGRQARDGIRNGAWLNAQEFPELQYAVTGLLPEGLTLLVGPPKAGKSWMSLDIALALASGGRALGAIAIPEARPVLLLALEDGWRRLQARSFKLLGDGVRIPMALDMLINVDQGDPLAYPREWLALRGGHRPLVVIDTYGKIADREKAGEGAYGRDYRVAASIKLLADEHPGTSVVVLHHTRKAGFGDFVDSVSGTNALPGAADTIMVLSRDRMGTGSILHVTGRDVPEGAYALDLVDGAWTLFGLGLKAAACEAKRRNEGGNLGQRTDEILQFVGDHSGGVTPKEVSLALGVDNKIASNKLRQLADAGLVALISRGRYGPMPDDLDETGERHESRSVA